MSIEEMIREIHETVVKHKPAEDDLLIAAVEVCQTRYSDKDWEELDQAISNLISVCIKAGIQFNNPRIGQ